MPKQFTKRELRWFREDSETSKSALLGLPLEGVIKWLPEELKLSGGILRFPGTQSEDNNVSIRCTKTFTTAAGGTLKRGEVFSGFGKGFKGGLVCAIICAYTLAHYRGTR